MLDIVHDCLASMVVGVVAVDITGMVMVLIRVVTVVLSLQMLVLVAITSPVGGSGVVLTRVLSIVVVIAAL